MPGMEQRIVLVAAVLLVTLTVMFPPTHSSDTDLLMAGLFSLACMWSLGRTYFSHSRITVATAMPRSSASER